MNKNTRNHIITIFALIAFVVVAGISLLVVRGLNTSNTVAPNAPQSQPKADNLSCQLTFTVPAPASTPTPEVLICSTAPSTTFNAATDSKGTWGFSLATQFSSAVVDTTKHQLVEKVSANNFAFYGTAAQIKGDLQAETTIASVTFVPGSLSDEKPRIFLYGQTDDANHFNVYWNGTDKIWADVTTKGTISATGRIATIEKPTSLQLRAVRVGGTVTFYYNPGSGWVFLDALSYPTANAVWIGVQSDVSTFSDTVKSGTMTTVISSILISCPGTTALRCDSTCSKDADCSTGLQCLSVHLGGPSGPDVLKCRNPSCSTASSCLCATATPSPSPTPTATPAIGCNSICSTNSDCPISMTCNSGRCRNPQNPEDANCTTPKNGGFFIRKYFDTNGNGKPESGEKGLTWKFEWDQNGDGNWRKYDTSENTNGEGGVVTLPEGTQVRIREIAVDGWTATSPTEVTIRIHVGDNQMMQFGNWKGGTVIVPTPGPACNSLCTTNSDCPSSMSCDKGICRNPSCTGSSSCLCSSATATPKASVTPTEKPQELPKSGAVEDTIKLLGVGVGAVLLGVVGLLAL